MREIIIKENEDKQRLDRFLKKYLNDAPNSFIYKMLRKKRIKLNKSKADPKDMIKTGDTIQMYLADETIDSFKKKSDTVKQDADDIIVVYEDQNILVVHKESNVLSHSTQKGEKSLVDSVLKYLNDKGEYDPENDTVFKPAICNRLDRNTIGLIIAAKNYMALKAINEAIRDKKIDKYYKCLVKGKMQGKFKLEDYISKDEKNNVSKVTNEKNDDSKKIQTNVNVLRSNSDFSLAQVELITGKSHQIRVHMEHIGHPIVGDYKYGDAKLNRLFKQKYGLEHQYLMAYKLKFNDMPKGLEYLNSKEIVDTMDKKFVDIEKDIFKS